MNHDYIDRKPSEIRWLDYIPSHWKEVPFFASFAENRRKNVNGLEQNLLSLSYGKIVRKDINGVEGLLPENFNGYQIVDKDFIVFRLTDLQNDKRSLRSAIVKETGIITSAYLGVSPLHGEPLYWDYLFRVYDLMKTFYFMGGGLRQSMKFEDMRRLPVIAPPIEEQRQIAAYLNRETAKIDKLIAKQQKLIKLLAEKRQAVINQAVTKGLDPNVEMKDSGVEWLGEVPEHWHVVRVKNLVASISSGTSVNSESEPARVDEYGVLKTSCVYGGKFEISENKKVLESEIERLQCPVRRGTLVVSRMNTPDLVGAAGYCFEDSSQIFLPDRLWQVDVKDGFARFVYFWTLCSAYRDQIKTACSGTSSSMQNLAQGDFLNFTLAVPNELSEVKNIILELESELEKLDSLVGKCRLSIDLLKEHRQALITAAVTGKIDVRDLVTDEEVAALDAELEDQEIDESLSDDSDEVSHTEGDEEEAL